MLCWLESNISNNRNALEFEGRVGYQGDYETETHLLRYFDKRQIWAAFVGFDSRNNKVLEREGKNSNLNSKNDR